MPIDPEDELQQTPSSNRLFHDDTEFAKKRISGFQVVTFGIFLFLLAGFWNLQVREYDANSQAAERNRIKTVPVPAPRGKILDRDGRVIVDNHSSFMAVLQQENLDERHLPGIAEGLGVDLKELRDRVERYGKGPKYVPIPVKEELTPAEVTFIEAHNDSSDYPELRVVEEQKRLYPQNGLAAHVVGFVRQVSDAQLNSVEFAKHEQGDIVGQTGLERQYNQLLTGVDGQRRVVVDSLQREREVLDSQEAVPGQDLHLTLDLDLQAVSELAMDGRRGAVVALDPRNGEVLAMVSRPAFDPNLFTSTLPQAEWDAIINNPFNPMLNRAIQAQFAPGSTFKPIVALAGLELGELDLSDEVLCNGGATYYDRFYRCHSRHGEVDLHTGIVQSCDVYFYDAGTKIGIDNIAHYAELTGIGERTGIDLPDEAEGLMPSSAWKLRTQRERWYLGETLSVAIGQGAVTVTPLQLASAIGGLVSGGTWYQPHLLDDGRPAEITRQEFFQETNIRAIVDGMYGVVNEGGTGAAAMIPGITVSGKTGSAQRVSNEFAAANDLAVNSLEDNGWFVGFAPRDNPEIVVAVLVESGLHGSSAAPIARDVIKAYFDKKERKVSAMPFNMALLLAPGTSAPINLRGGR